MKACLRHYSAKTKRIKSVYIRGFSGLYFPSFGLNTEICSVNLSFQSKYVKMRPRKTLNSDTFNSVYQFMQMWNPPLIAPYILRYVRVILILEPWEVQSL